MPKHTISISCCFEVVVALFYITKPREKLEARSRLYTGKQNWKGLIELFLGDL